MATHRVHNGEGQLVSMNAIVEVEGVTRAFGETKALQGVDLVVPEASVVALLGPNGAGKTTLVRILATLLAPDSGTARVAGLRHPGAPDGGAAVDRPRRPVRRGRRRRSPAARTSR